MEYRTVAQTAQRWQVSERLVRRLLAQNRIPGAERMSGGWLIPADARKPADNRSQKNALPQPLFPKSSELSPGGKKVLALSVALNTLQKERAKELAKDPVDPGDPWEVAWLLGVGRLAIYEGDSPRWKEILGLLAEKGDSSAELVRIYLFSLLGQVHTVPAWLWNTDFQALHPDSLPFAWISYLMLLGASGQNQRMVGAAEACCQMFALCPTPLWLYIQLLTAAGFQRIGDTEASSRHFQKAAERAAREYMWGPFVELQNMMVGMLPRLEKVAGARLNRLKEEWIAFGEGWMRLRMQTLSAYMSEILTPRERDVALLAAAGDINRIIGEKLGISEATVKKYLEVVYQKLEVRSRNELKQVLSAPSGQSDIHKTE